MTIFFGTWVLLVSQAVRVCAGLPALHASATAQLWRHVLTLSCMLGVPWGLCLFALVVVRVHCDVLHHCMIPSLGV